MIRKLIWILDSNPQDRPIYRELLDESFETQFFERFSDLSEFKKAHPHLVPAMIIMDAQLDDGMLHQLVPLTNQILRQIPTLVVTRNDDPDAIAHGFELGILDWINKPIQKNTFLIKISRLVTRSGSVSHPKQLFEQIRQLTLKERLILEALFENSDHTATRKEIIEYVWKGVHVSAKTLDVHLYHLRRKIRLHGYDVIAQTNGRMKFLSKSQGGESTAADIATNALTSLPVNGELVEFIPRTHEVQIAQ